MTEGRLKRLATHRTSLTTTLCSQLVAERSAERTVLTDGPRESFLVWCCPRRRPNPKCCEQHGLEGAWRRVPPQNVISVQRLNASVKERATGRLRPVFLADESHQALRRPSVRVRSDRTRSEQQSLVTGNPCVIPCPCHTRHPASSEDERHCSAAV